MVRRICARVLDFPLVPLQETDISQDLNIRRLSK
jgi:hypothetical protein